MRSPLSVCIFYTSDALVQKLSQYLRTIPLGEKVGGRYTISQFNTVEGVVRFIKQGLHHIDCLILEENPDLPNLLTHLQQQEILFPTVIVQASSYSGDEDRDRDKPGDRDRDENEEAIRSPTSAEEVGQSVPYHPATIILEADQLSQIGFAIDQAISKFIQLSLTNPPAESSEASSASSTELPSTQQRTLSLKAQQIRLAEKLKERLGYLGIYYKRNPQNFLRQMTQPQREELLQQLKQEYREIILSYFSDENTLNQKIDNFVNVAFFADIPVAQIVEIHMDLMDEFSKQLKLEGRSDEILQDYRLTLIDTIAHLCEMYRRSIPRDT